VRRLLGVAALVPVAALVSACGVTAEDVPTLIEESTRERPPAIPSFDKETSPPPTTSTSAPPRLVSPPG
jgi:hypothetical protein